MRILVIAALSLATPALAQDAAPFRFAIASAPTSPEAAQKHAKALEPYLSRALKKKVEITVATSYDALAEDLAVGKLDGAWMQPLAFTRARAKNAGVTALVKTIRNGSGFYRSVIFAQAGKRIATLSDLRGKRAAWVDKHSTSGYLFPRVVMRAQGYDAEKLLGSEEFAGSHAAVCKAVASGKADVGATYADVPAEGRALQIDGCTGAVNLKKLVIVEMSGPISNDVFAARAGLAAEDAEALKQAALTMHKDKDGKKLLKDVFEAQSWAESAPDDFQSVARASEAWQGAGKPEVTEK